LLQNLETIGADWLAERIAEIPETIARVRPSTYNEGARYLPESVTNLPGFIRYDVAPYMREIVDCLDVDSPVREVVLKKGAQIAYTTSVLEAGMFYYIGHVRTLPLMYITADSELAASRVENNILPMLHQSGLSGVIRSADEGNIRKTGKNKSQIQFAGGGYLIPQGAQNANKMRAVSVAVILQDEIDAWPLIVGKQGDPLALTDARASGYYDRRKIFRGSTPLLKGSSKIETAFMRGDQRVYRVLCRACNFPQALRWETIDKATGIVGGFTWDTDGGMLVEGSVRWRCASCGHAHAEHDKARLFSAAEGAHWHPTARPAADWLRSYHLPGLYSPVGMAPWSSCVDKYLQSYDPIERRVIDIGKYQAFYNNILGETFETRGARISFMSVSSHRRTAYNMGQIPNAYAIKYAGSPVLFLTCQVDVHKTFLRVAIMGWSRDTRCFLVDYTRIEGADFTETTEPGWGELRRVIEEKKYTADNGTQYGINLTLIDAGYTNATVSAFCGEYSQGVYPILGRDRPSKNQRITEFAEFKTQAGTLGYRILVDHYKDRIAPVLRREWHEDSGPQAIYHFNAPVDTSDEDLKELTRETRREITDEAGGVTYKWHRPGNARNELWDLLGYGHAAVEILAWQICIRHFELDMVEWPRFWDFVEATPSAFGRSV
jgi:phage terminase large subunit GpA-like protein